MLKRVRLKRKARSESKVVSSAPAPRSWLFGQPNILEGEDADAYEELLARVRAAVKPVDILEEIFIADLVSSEWEGLRWSRLKLTLIRAHGLEALEEFLRDKLCYDAYSERFAHDLAEILRNNLPEDPPEDAETLACGCAQNESDAIDKVNEILAGSGTDMDDVLNGARARKAKEVVSEYVRRESEAVTLVHELLAEARASIDVFMADALSEKLDSIERIDRLAAIAESRRNASLNELERRRAVLSPTLRQAVREIEDAEFKVIDTMPANGKKAS
ncbi:MAG: hypothetical protein ACXWIO_09000 [Croceibacterium sp.]